MVEGIDFEFRPKLSFLKYLADESATKTTESEEGIPLTTVL